jgi:hypothetical protein
MKLLLGASCLLSSAMIGGCQKGPQATPPSRSMPLTVVKSSVYSTAVPSTWEVRISGSNVLEAFDPLAPSLKHSSSLYFMAKPSSGNCSAETVPTSSGPACVTVREERDVQVPSTIVEVQTPKQYLRIIDSVSQGEKPTSADEVKALALRIVGMGGGSLVQPPGTLVVQPSPSPAATQTAEAK